MRAIGKWVLRVLLAILFLAAIFAYLPIPGISRPAANEERAALADVRTTELFLGIVKSSNLDRPFPRMQVRPDNPTTAEKVELGRLLYFDPILSGDNTVSCAHCHHPDLGFSDNLGQSIGKDGVGLGQNREEGTLLRRGSPTIWNAAFSHRQFWDGRASDLEDQAGNPIQDPKEMNQNPEELVAEIRNIPEYVKRFKRAFDLIDAEAITFDQITYALAAFERTIVSANSRFDRYAAGERDALSLEERAGLNVFRSLKTRCFECHNFPTFANPDFKVIGVPTLEGTPVDLGRGEIDGEAYNHAFKVPTLRNVALTAPYMHNGAFDTLSEVIDFYAAGGGVGLGLDFPNLDDKIRPFKLTEEEKAALIAFLHSLTDESSKPEIPETVPSGLTVVPELENQSAELKAFAGNRATKPIEQLQRDGRRIIVEAGDRIQDAVDQAYPGDTILVRAGTYFETITLDLDGITLQGDTAGGMMPILDGQNQLSDALIGSGSDFIISNFVVKDYTANGIMLDGATNVVFRDLVCENTGLYGIYPVGCMNVLVERCTVSGTRDAGIYVGQSQNILVRDNIAYENVTGIEIENSLYAIVEGNEVYDNTGGILVFLLPNNPSKVSRHCRVINNRIVNNNTANFADPTAIVGMVPAGTGLMILAADSVEVALNVIKDNNSFGVAMIHLDMVFGEGSAYDVDPSPDGNWIHSNVFENNGSKPAGIIAEAGFDGRDLLWDLSGVGNSWDQPDASRLPPGLPDSGWMDLRRRLNQRTWALLMKIAG